MYIRKTKTSSRKNGGSYYTYRLVESVRTEKGVSQRTLLNLGKDFPFPKDQWPALSRRIKDILGGQTSLVPLDENLEPAAQRYAARIIQAQENNFELEENKKNISEFHSIDINSVEMARPRSVSIEHVVYDSLRQLKLDKKLVDFGFNKHEVHSALGVLVGRMAAPGSELFTHNWLRNHSGLGELVNYDYEGMSLTRIYKASDLLFSHKEKLETHLYERERSLFQFQETITLYDLTNTYFEGSGLFNDFASYGHSKEKRTDCPIVTLGLVLDGSGFPKKSEFFKGNVTESKTLEGMIESLTSNSDSRKQQSLITHKPTIVMDAGIATEANVDWLKSQQYPYIVVSRKRHKEFSEEKAVLIKKDKNSIVRAYKVLNKKTDEIELYCHSSLREEKEKAIRNQFSVRFEDSLQKMDAGLHKKGCLKKYDKVLEKLGRLKQQYNRVQKNYKITVKKDEQSANAVKVDWKHTHQPDSADENPGVYCLRTNQDLDEKELWSTYTMLTDLEAVFRSLKSELGLRPNFHQKKDRVLAHIFISLLSYHVVHTIRCQLKKKGINSSWNSLRQQLKGQNRTTITMQSHDNEIIHIRKSTHPEPRQQTIYNALNLPHHPGKAVKKIVKIKNKICSAIATPPERLTS